MASKLPTQKSENAWFGAYRMFGFQNVCLLVATEGAELYQGPNF
jgi:hypothetical protein